MKILKYLLAFVLILILLFILKGLFTPSVYYECEVSVNKSAEQAWAVMTDDSTLPQWINGFKKTELVSGTANTVGAVSKIYIEENGQEMTMQETIKSIKANNHIAMNFSMDFMDMDYEISFKEEAGKTLIRSKSTTKGNGIMAKSIVSFMPSSMKKQEQENLTRLKKLIEAQN